MSQENQKTSLWDLMTKSTASQGDRLLRGQARTKPGTRGGSRFAATPRQGANRAMPINAIGGKDRQRNSLKDTERKSFPLLCKCLILFRGCDPPTGRSKHRATT